VLSHEPERSEWERTTSLSRESGGGHGRATAGCGVLALVGLAVVITLLTREPAVLELASVIPGPDDDDDQPSRLAHRKPKRRRFARLRRWWRGGTSGDEHEDVVVHPDERLELKPAPTMRRIEPKRLRRPEDPT
jgi:hypothetical protein